MFATMNAYAILRHNDNTMAQIAYTKQEKVKCKEVEPENCDEFDVSHWPVGWLQ